MAVLRRLVLGVMVLAASPGLASQRAEAPEHQVKAVFLFNFAQFVDWPARATPDSAPVVIGVLGDDPFGRVLDATVRGEHLGTRPFAVRRFARVEEIGACDILFISQSEGSRVDAILSDLGSRPILTVSDIHGFADRGGMIHFVTDRNHIRLKINVDAARAAHLTISSKLLRLAEIVSTQGR
jgi:hypothetical protein